MTDKTVEVRNTSKKKTHLSATGVDVPAGKTVEVAEWVAVLLCDLPGSPWERVE